LFTGDIVKILSSKLEDDLILFLIEGDVVKLEIYDRLQYLCLKHLKLIPCRSEEILDAVLNDLLPFALLAEVLVYGGLDGGEGVDVVRFVSLGVALDTTLDVADGCVASASQAGTQMGDLLVVNPALVSHFLEFATHLSWDLLLYYCKLIMLSFWEIFLGNWQYEAEGGILCS
jgi:hypothetical protein